MILQADNISKTYGERLVLDKLSLQLKQGECLGLLGPNGAGKTTSLRSLLGLVQSDSGSISIMGHPIPEEALLARAATGVVPQMNALDPDFNCEENLLIFARYFGIAAKEAKARIPALLAFAGLEKRAHEKISMLSGGMQRRLSLARALINHPKLLFLDEPTTGLDPQARHLIWERLRQLRREGKALLLTTHFMEEAERLCDRIIVIDQGRMIAHGTLQSLLAEHVEAVVLEIDDAKASKWIQSHASLVTRWESFGKLIYCYAQRPEPLIEALSKTDFSYLRRTANLEDVFLKLTGRDLRD